MNPRSSTRSQPQKLRDRLREVTTEAILGAAEKVFAQQGVHGAKMELIAAEAGVAVGTLYNHFQDRQALFDCLIDARRAELLGRVDEALRATRAERFEGQLRAVVSALAQHLEEHQPFLSILMEGEASQNCRTFPVTIAKPRRAMEEIYHRLEALVQRGLESKELRREDAAVYPTVLMGMLRGAMMRRLYHARTHEPPMTEHVDAFVRCFLRGAGV